jgi:hypothetical protein
MRASGSDYRLRIIYNAGGTGITLEDVAQTCTTNTWYFWKIKYDYADTKDFSAYRNGVLYDSDTISGTWGDDITNIRIACRYNNSGASDIYFSDIFITDDPNTPEIWTAFGKPLHTEITDVS